MTVVPVVRLGGYVVKSEIWGLITVVSLLSVGLTVSLLFWFGIWPLDHVGIFEAFSQVVLAGIAIYAIINKLD